MLNIQKVKSPEFVLISVSLVIVAFFYGRILLSPNQYMFGTTGDAIKNYYTYAYYISHNDSYTNFEGMNYPYGESFLYTDCHPILASAASFLLQKKKSKNSV